MTIKEKAAAMKIDSTKMAVTSTDTRNNALALIAKKLIENQKEIY